MVSFIANPDIALAQEQRRLSLAKMLQGYTPPQNPYGYTTAGVFAPLAHALSARWKGQEASRLQTQQQTARGEVLGNLLGLQTGTPGAQQYGVNQVDVGGLSGATVGRVARQAIDDAGAAVPLDSALLGRAGLSAGEYAIEEQQARLAGRERSEENRLNFARRKLAEARTNKDKEFWLSEIDAVSSAERDIESQIRMRERVATEEAAAKFDIEWAVRVSDGKKVPVSDYELSQNPDKYSPVPEPVDRGEVPTWVGNQHLQLMEEVASSEAIINTNEAALRIVTETDLETGAFTPIITKFKSYLQGLGEPVEGLAPAQVLDSIAKKKALLTRNPESGLGLTGNTSDRDLRFLEAAVVGLAKTNQANEALLIIDTAAHRRKVKAKRLQMKWIALHPYTGLIGYDNSAANKSLMDEDLFTKNEVEQLNHLLEIKKPLKGGDGPTEGGQGELPTDTYIEPWSSD